LPHFFVTLHYNCDAIDLALTKKDFMEKVKEIYEGHIMPKSKCPEITTEDINKFFEGSDPMKNIINIELAYNDAEAEIVYVDDKGIKRIRKEPFKPFVWAKNSACIRMFGGQRGLLRSKMREYGIKVKPLYTCTEDNPYPHEKLTNGYKYLFYSTHKQSMGKFQGFFNEAGTPLKPKKKEDNSPSSQEFLYLQPVEQFMIETGKRYFKGIDNYDDLKRMSFDLETEGLNPKIHHISQIGIRTNKGFEKIITITGKDKQEKEVNEVKGIIEFCKIIAEEKPDVIFGHNTENFDWDFIIVRCQTYGIDFKELSGNYLREGIYKQKRPTTLKLGGEVETYFATIIKYHNVVDSLHAVRRAMATDSSFESANLKYATKYLKLDKNNRVYVPGNLIDTTWLVTEPEYAFNNDNGDWYHISEEKPLKEGYETVSGKYIVERYLLDDIWEADKVELTLHETDFQLTKIMPTTFMRVCTMGTATQWKLIMLTWAFQHDLAVPTLSPNRKFTGGLSRLLVTGYMNKIFKADYNSLYPSTILTWNITCATDIMGVMLRMLRYVLTQREYYKGLKKKAGAKAEELYHQLENMNENDPQYAQLTQERKLYLADKINNDNQQLILKKLGNSFFGSFGCPSVFNFADLEAAEKTTCIGRQLLRLMISHFKKLGYVPIVGDSVTGDTPLFIRYNDTHLIDIKPISEIFDEKYKDTDNLNREYDMSIKPFQVLCRSGWRNINYVYRHTTKKDIYRVSNEAGYVDVTKDHSLFNENKKEIKPTEINSETKLEINSHNIWSSFSSPLVKETSQRIEQMAKMLINKTIDRVPIYILNATPRQKRLFVDLVQDMVTIDNGYSKTAVAGINYLNIAKNDTKTLYNNSYKKEKLICQQN
jgi:hypothetical protein